MGLTPRAEVIEKGLQLVHAFEGGHLAGNFDGQVMSWGPLQWNLGQGTLQPLLKRMLDIDEGTVTDILGSAFVTALQEDRIVRFVQENVLRANQTPERGWRDVFAELADTRIAQVAFREHAGWYVDRATRDATRLRLVSERAWVFCLDVAVQNGGIRVRDHLPTYWGSLTKEHVQEWQHLKALAKAVSAGSNARWRHDVLTRKLTIAVRTGTVHGRRHDIFEDFRISHLLDWAEDRPGSWPTPARA